MVDPTSVPSLGSTFENMLERHLQEHAVWSTTTTGNAPNTGLTLANMQQTWRAVQPRELLVSPELQEAARTILYDPVPIGEWRHQSYGMALLMDDYDKTEEFKEDSKVLRKVSPKFSEYLKDKGVL